MHLLNANCPRRLPPFETAANQFLPRQIACGRSCFKVRPRKPTDTVLADSLLSEVNNCPEKNPHFDYLSSKAGRRRSCPHPLSLPRSLSPPPTPLAARLPATFCLKSCAAVFSRVVRREMCGFRFVAEAAEASMYLFFPSGKHTKRCPKFLLAYRCRFMRTTEIRASSGLVK